MNSILIWRIFVRNAAIAAAACNFSAESFRLSDVNSERAMFTSSYRRETVLSGEWLSRAVSDWSRP